MACASRTCGGPEKGLLGPYPGQLKQRRTRDYDDAAGRGWDKLGIPHLQRGDTVRGTEDRPEGQAILSTCWGGGGG